MSLASLRYSAPMRAARATKWAADWRKRWFRSVGSVHEHYLTKQLVIFYSDERPPEARLALQRELEARTNGIGEVLAVCRAQARAWNRAVDEANRRHTARATAEQVPA